MTAAQARSRPLLEPSSPRDWASWLEANHDSSAGAWLAVGKKGNTRTTLTYEAAVEEALCWGWIDSTVNRLDEDRFKQLFTPRRPRSTWSRSNKERVERLLAAGRMQPAGLAAVEVAKANGSWETLDDVEALVAPAELAAALEADPAAATGFERLNESTRKMAYYWIASAKRPETRAKRVHATVAAARDGRSPV